MYYESEFTGEQMDLAIAMILNGSAYARVTTVTFHENAIIPATGSVELVDGHNALIISCKGTSTSRNIVVHGIDFNDVDNILPGFSVVDFTMSSAITTKDLTFEYSVGGLKSVYAEIVSVSGGNATIKGAFRI